MKYYLKNAWHHIRRSPYHGLIAVLLMFMVFFIISIFAVVSYGSHKTLTYFETKPQITAFFQDDAVSSDIDILKAQLMQTGKVKESKFISKNEALKIYREQNKNDPLLLEMVTASILPSSIEISVNNISEIDEIIKVLKANAKVEEVVFQQDIVNSLKKWTGFLRKAGIGIIIALFIMSVTVMIAIIGLKISKHKAEVEVSGLIGATRCFIVWPFAIEGMFYGFVGVVSGWGACFLLLLGFSKYIAEFFTGINIWPVPIELTLGTLGTETFVGIIIGGLSGVFAAKRLAKS